MRGLNPNGVSSTTRRREDRRLKEKNPRRGYQRRVLQTRRGCGSFNELRGLGLGHLKNGTSCADSAKPRRGGAGNGGWREWPKGQTWRDCPLGSGEVEEGRNPERVGIGDCLLI